MTLNQLRLRRATTNTGFLILKRKRFTVKAKRSWILKREILKAEVV
jgi:hypothetical protein